MAILVECENCGKQAPARWIESGGLGGDVARGTLTGPHGWTGTTRCDECNEAVTAATAEALRARQQPARGGPE